MNPIAIRSIAALAAATTLLAACGGGGASIGPGPNFGSTPTPGPGGGTGPGSGPGGGSASPTPSPGSGGPTGGGGSATPTPTPTSGTGGGGATPTPAPASPSPIATQGIVALTAGPRSINAALGSVAQIGVLDPNSTSPVTVSVAGGGLTGLILNTINTVTSAATSGTGGQSLLTVDLAQLANLGVLGSGVLLHICSAANSSICSDVNLASNPTTSGIISNLASVVLNGPGQGPTLKLLSTLGTLTNFTVTADNANINVVNLGNGSFRIDGSANLTMPLGANLTVNDGMGHTITIPVQVL